MTKIQVEESCLNSTFSQKIKKIPKNWDKLRKKINYICVGFII